MVIIRVMTGEAHSFPPAAEVVDDQEPPLDYEAILNNFGIGPDEADAVVSFGAYTGTLGSVLSDDRCPVGGMLSKAHKAGGIEGVATKLAGFASVDESFSVEISDRTRAYHEGTVGREDLLHRQRPEVGRGESFLGPLITSGLVETRGL